MHWTTQTHSAAFESTSSFARSMSVKRDACLIGAPMLASVFGSDRKQGSDPMAARHHGRPHSVDLQVIEVSRVRMEHNSLYSASSIMPKRTICKRIIAAFTRAYTAARSRWTRSPFRLTNRKKKVLLRSNKFQMVSKGVPPLKQQLRMQLSVLSHHVSLRRWL
jgi:hypothetical protein